MKMIDINIEYSFFVIYISDIKICHIGKLTFNVTNICVDMFFMHFDKKVNTISIITFLRNQIDFISPYIQIIMFSRYYLRN